jgi:hypothetical protein
MNQYSVEKYVHVESIVHKHVPVGGINEGEP